MPENTRYVGRGTKWGNPFRVGYDVDIGVIDADRAVFLYKRHYHESDLHKYLDEIKGKNLCCWCKLSEPCHADILLEIANG